MEAVLTEELDEEEQLVRRHHKEKELQAKIQSWKNAVPWNDKKRRKQLTEDVAKLEAEMEQKHTEELDQLKLTSKETRQLEIKQIPSDGHCMYRAIEDQLKEQNGVLTVAALRCQTANYMQSHVEDFLPFLTNPNTGEMYTPEEFGKYCDDIVNTAAWGGQLELRALSHILQTPIEIIQADSPPIVVGEEYPEDPLILVYMRHAYGLGEHYNSVTRLVNTATENCS
ncbi:hypothetical protein M91_15455 [Bos mutus]|uniref:ubiquitinyl hydrolase 1 n=1 Tax=Bos mutus TaxID=72004 RepID=L8ITV1_9CETA|nr:hypothetical protein M91_15455 [Bos mutus]